jgi:hypothetical protein
MICSQQRRQLNDGKLVRPAVTVRCRQWSTPQAARILLMLQCTDRFAPEKPPTTARLMWREDVTWM